MNVRRATDADRETLYTLWDEWVAAESPPPPWVDDAQAGTRAGIDQAVAEGSAVIAEHDGEVVGFACGVMTGSRLAALNELYVRPGARGHGVAHELVAAVVAELRGLGAGWVTVTGPVESENAPARRFYESAGFQAESLRLVADVETLERRLSRRAAGASFGSIHLQSDDLPAVERAVRQFVPRLPGGSRGSVVAPPRNGWIAVYDELCDRDPAQLRRLGQELSDRLGAVVVTAGVEEGAVARYVFFERGRILDEYLSVPEYHGPVPPGIVVSLAVNPTVVSRLTGADPRAIRAAARQAHAVEDLPPAVDLVREVADAIGIQDADRGYGGARDLPGAVTLERV